MTNLVIIGGSDAGTSAALRARELNASADVTVVLADRFPNYSIAAKCPIGTGWPIGRRKTSPEKESTCSLTTRPRPSTLPTSLSQGPTGVGRGARLGMIDWH